MPINVKAILPARQILVYGLIGITVNLASYMAYLLITYIGGTPKLTMTALYIATALMSYFGNRRYTFRHTGSIRRSGALFILAHGIGYLINLIMLYVLVDRFGYPHQLVQILAIFVVAGFLFVTFKLLVFRKQAVAQ